MHFVKKELLIILFIITVVTGLHAQQAIVAAGGNALGMGGSVSYSVGQTAYSYLTGTNSSVSQGVQQPFEISTLTTTSTAVKEVVGINLSCKAYPNPVTDQLTLDVDDNLFQNKAHVTFQLYDVTGNVINDQIVTDDQTSI